MSVTKDNRGGKRKRSGRPPSSKSINIDTNNSIVSLAPSNIHIKDIDIKSLSPQQITAAHFLGLGFSQIKAAQFTGVHRKSVGNWIKNDTFQSLVSYFAMNEDDPWRFLAPPALKNLAGAISKGNIPVSLYATDQRYGKPVVREMRQEKRDISVTIHVIGPGEPTYEDHD